MSIAFEMHFPMFVVGIDLFLCFPCSFLVLAIFELDAIGWYVSLFSRVSFWDRLGSHPLGSPMARLRSPMCRDVDDSLF